jgi:outer membrane receptor protein involved in Fe transport
MNFTGAPYDSSTVAAVLDERELNLASQHVEGLDLLADYKHDVSRGQLDLFVNGSYLQVRQQITEAAPEQEIAGNAFNPPRFRARGGATIGAGPWSATAILNWLGSSTNTYQPTLPRVASWSVVDLQLSYVAPFDGVLKGVRASFAVRNLFDKDPPYLRYDSRTFVGFNYDSLNTNPLGRFITLQLSKSWGPDRDDR